MVTTNDDAVVDCIVYANEIRIGDREDNAKGCRRVIDFDAQGKDCSISMCGNEDDPECRMLRYCENGHCLHDKCLEQIFLATDSLSVVVCPQCRSKKVMQLVVDAVPIPMAQFESHYAPSRWASKAIKSVVPEFRGTSMLPMLIKKMELDKESNGAP